MRLATRILRLGMPAEKAEALAGDLAEDLARRWPSPLARTPMLLALASGYALMALAGRIAGLFQPTDIRLALRMLVKYPGLTVIAVFSMAIAVACGAAAFAVYEFLWPTLPLPGGDRIVSIENYDARRRNDNRQVLHDFAIWREELKSLTEVGAFLSTRRNLITESGVVENVPLAQMSAAGFRVASGAPLMGRMLEARDEQPDAEPVMVIGELVWRRTFNAEPSVVGQTAKLGTTVHTIVGVMPQRFGFPVNHSLWVPLRLNPNAYARGTGPSLDVFARLAPGVEQPAAEAELSAIGARVAQQFPETNKHLRPRIVPFTSVFADFDDLEDLYTLEAAVVMLVLVIAVNVAILVYARTVTRAGEIAVRAALGAGRGRIVSQLFVEAAALAAAAGVIGLVILKIVLVQFESLVDSFIPSGAPFWMDFGISPRIVITTAALCLLAAAVAGIVPALKVTGRRVQSGLQNLSTRGSALRLGKGWTTLVVGQVALTAALLPGVAMLAYSNLKFSKADPGFAAGHFLRADLGLDLEHVATGTEAETARAMTDAARARFDARFLARQTELKRALALEPGVTAVTGLWTMPGREPNMRITIDGRGDERHEIRFMRVDPDFFPAFGATIIGGRAFTATENVPGATPVIVNQHFADRFTPGGSPLGMQIRYVPNQAQGQPAMAQDGVTLPATYEIVGVVSNVPARELSAIAATVRVYHPSTPEAPPDRIAIRVAPEQAEAVSRRIRELAVAIDPAFRINRVESLLEIYQGDKTEERWGAIMLSAITLSVLVLAGGGIYALMSVTVSRRRREIGIRAALGGEPRGILAAIFGRALALLATGALIGMIPALALLQTEEIFSGPVSNWEIAALYAAVVLFLIGVGAAAAYGPARRGLRIQPTEALRADN